MYACVYLFISSFDDFWPLGRTIAFGRTIVHSDGRSDCRTLYIAFSQYVICDKCAIFHNPCKTNSVVCRRKYDGRDDAAVSSTKTRNLMYEDLRYDAKDYMRDHTHGEPEETEKTIRNAIKVHDHFYHWTV